MMTVCQLVYLAELAIGGAMTTNGERGFHGTSIWDIKGGGLLVLVHPGSNLYLGCVTSSRLTMEAKIELG